jgi:hypothetical protein
LIFRGLSDFRTKDPALLAVDLQREHRAVGNALGELERERASRWTSWRRVDANGNRLAAFDEALVADMTPGNFVIQLPEAGIQQVGRGVLVCLGYGTGTLTITATNGTVNGGTSDSLSTAPSGKGYRVYLWDGSSGWWRNHSA